MRVIPTRNGRTDYKVRGEEYLYSNGHDTPAEIIFLLVLNRAFFMSTSQQYLFTQSIILLEVCQEQVLIAPGVKVAMHEGVFQQRLANLWLIVPVMQLYCF